MLKSRRKFFEIESERGTIKAIDFCEKKQKENKSILYRIKEDGRYV